MQENYSKEIPKVIINTYHKFSNPQWDLIVEEASKISNNREDFVLNLGKICYLLYSLGDWVVGEIKKLKFEPDKTIAPETKVPVIFIKGMGKFIHRPYAKMINKHKRKLYGHND